jgi:hypothetical protein
MSNEVDAIGSAVTGGLVGGAIEGDRKGWFRRKARSEEAPHHGVCRNCEAQTTGHYCSSCGQATHTHRTLLHFLEELLHGVFHFDSKSWRTLPMIVFRPGTLTHNYIHGKRVRYVSPMAMFLFTVFAMFVVFSFLPPVNVNAGREVNTDGGVRVEVDGNEYFDGVIIDTDSGAPAPASTAAPEGSSTSSPAPVAPPASAAPAPNPATAVVTAVVPPVVAKPDAKLVEPEDCGGLCWTDLPGEEEGASERRTDARIAAYAAEHGGQIPFGEAIKIAIQEQAGRVFFINDEMTEKLKHKMENPDLLFYKLQNTAYKYFFLLVPLSIPFIGLLFLWRRGTTWYDHSVFALYSLSFMSLLLILSLSLGRLHPALGGPLASLMFFAPPVHLFFQLGGTYKLSLFSTAWRTMFLAIGLWIILAVFILVILALGVLG